MSKTIMVPLDGSTFSEHAVAAGLSVVKASGGRLHLVQAHELPIVPTSPDVLVPYDARWDAALREQEREYLGGIMNRIAERAGVGVRTELVDGPPAMALATYAREMEIDLIVMTTHGRGGFSRMWLGSVADGLVRRSGVPVMLLRPAETAVDLTEELKLRHVLVPLDGSELSRGVVEPAAWLGSLFGARFTLLRVVLPAPLIRPPVPMSEGEFSGMLVREQEDHARSELEGVAVHLRSRGLDVEVDVTVGAVPAQGILSYASTHAVDLIALATHGRGGWSRLALGSVSDKVLRGADVPVMMYRPPVAGHEPRTGIDDREAVARS